MPKSMLPLLCTALTGLLFATTFDAIAAGRIAIVKDETIPIENSAPSSPAHLASLLRSAGHEVRFIRAADLADPNVLNAKALDIVILPQGSAFPYEAVESMRTYLEAGGSFFSTGGYVFDDLYHLDEPGAAQGFREGFEEGQMARWAPRSGQDKQPGVSFERVGDVKHSGDHAYRITLRGDGKKAWYILSRRFEFAKPGESLFGQAWVKTDDVRDGFAYIGFGFFDQNGKRISHTQSRTDAKGTMDWSLRTCAGTVPKGTAYALFNCILYGYGTVWFDDAEVKVVDNRMLNTRYGHGAHAGILHTRAGQVGALDASFPLRHVASAATSDDQCIFDEDVMLKGEFQGWSAAAMITAKTWDRDLCRRWIPLIDAFDTYGRLRGSVGALVFNYGKPFKGSAWAFFGVNSRDIFDPEDAAMGRLFLRVIDRMLARTFLHDLTSNYYCYRQGEPVTLTVSASNLGKEACTADVRIEVLDGAGEKALFSQSKTLEMAPGSTTPVEFRWEPETFDLDFYRYRAVMTSGGKTIDRMTNAFVVWNDQTIASGLKLRYKDNYFHIGDLPTLLCGSNHYSILFSSLNQDPERWDRDFSIMRDNGVSILRILHLTAQAGERKPGMRMPDVSNPPEWLLRRFDALVQLSQKHQVMLFLSAHDHIKLELSDEELAAEQHWCEMLSKRYAGVPGLIWDIQNEPFVFSPRLRKNPEGQALYNRYLESKYPSTADLRAAWGKNYADVELGKVALPGAKMWHFDWTDKSALDFERARVWILKRWIDANAAGLRKGDAAKPVTVGYLPTETAAERWLGNEATDFANFHAYAARDDLVKKLKFIDQRSLGKSMSIGEFGVNFHPGMFRANGYRKASWMLDPQECSELFLQLTHEAFGLGASSVANWLWSDSAEIIFSMGLVHAHRHTARDLLKVYRNCSLLFRRFHPTYVAPEVYFVIADSHRLGGQAKRVTDAILNGLDMLVKCHVSFAVINESSLHRLPETARVLIYPIPFCPPDEVHDMLCEFVAKGGILYVSGDISYDTHRERTKTNRLDDLCGVRFIKENYPNVMVEKAMPVEVEGEERRPCIEVDPITAFPYGDDEAAHPIMVINHIGKGAVYFTTDPVELYADSTRTGTYRDFLHCAKVARISITPDKPTLHVHRLHTQDGGRVYVLFNNEKDAYERIMLFDVKPDVAVDVHPRMPGLVAFNAKKEMVAAESQGDVIHGIERIIEAEMHFMLCSLDGNGIERSPMLLLMPFGPGTIRIASRVLPADAHGVVGEVRDGAWVQLEEARCQGAKGKLRVVVTRDQALNLFLLAPKAKMAEAVERLEKLVCFGRKQTEKGHEERD